MKIALSASAWLSIWGSTWGLRTSSTYFWAVRPPWMSTKSILQSLATHPHTFTDIRPDAWLGAMLSSWYRSPRLRHTRKLPFLLVRLNEHSSLQWTRFHIGSQYLILPRHHSNLIWNINGENKPLEWASIADKITPLLAYLPMALGQFRFSHRSTVPDVELPQP